MDIQYRLRVGREQGVSSAGGKQANSTRLFMKSASWGLYEQIYNKCAYVEPTNHTRKPKTSVKKLLIYVQIMWANKIYDSYFHMTPGVFRTRRALAGFDRASAAYALHMTIGVLTTLGVQRVGFPL